MQTWLYDFFIKELGPRMQEKEGRELKQPLEYAKNSSFWVEPKDPIFALAHHKFNVPGLFMPRIFLWLPHFFVKKLLCPSCDSEKALEKNGIARPRRIVDLDQCYWLVTWRYQCRHGCKQHFQGWSSSLIGTLPRSVQNSFPAVLSYCSAISHGLAQVLQVCYQHKMGAAGVRALLIELHTRRFDRLCLQYLETALEVEILHRESQTTNSTRKDIWQSTLDKSFTFKQQVLQALGPFRYREGYCGFVPSKHYLKTLYNKLADDGTPAADQLTSLYPLTQLSIDDSYKVCDV
jgi:hypothetical protein